MDEQCSFLFNKTNIMKNCAFTGHRHLSENFSLSAMQNTILHCIEIGVENFYNGMAVGFDLLAAETVLSLKKKYPQIKLIACVPCYNQEKSFPEEDKKRYVKILKKADKTEVLSPHYYNGCMQYRNRFMADRADILVAYCNEETGGTAYTVNYYQKTKPLNEILFI